MSLQSNQYADLLKYLEDETSKTSSIKKDSVKKIEKEKVSIDTKQLIKDSLEGLHSDVKFNTSPISTSRGFVVKDFESLMRAKLVDEHKRMQSYERPYISVTELFNCLRKNYYTRKKYKIDVVSQYNFSYLYMINKVGNTVHDLIQGLYDHTEVEKPIISEKYKVKGRVDGIRSNFVLEYKTIDESKFQGKYFPAHYNQGIIYAYILNTEYGYNIDTITIVYIVRNLKRIVPFDLPLNNNKAKNFLELAPTLIHCLKNDIIPEPVNSDKEQCHWCQYKSYCEQDKITNTDMEPVKTNTRSVFLL